MNKNIEYISDDAVDDAADAELRGLLSTCFTKPQDTVFRTRRYFLEPYRHRWVIRDGQGAIIAHAGVHEKAVEADGEIYRIGGIAEVCVHPEFRGRGSVRAMLQQIHGWLQQNGFTYAVLFGNPQVYGSSGYVSVDNLVYDGEVEGWKPVTALVKELSAAPWPRVEVRLPGPTF